MIFVGCVLSKVGICDLNQISLLLSRLDGIHWVDMSETTSFPQRSLRA
jgi:hypothetical protein